MAGAQLSGARSPTGKERPTEALTSARHEEANACTPQDIVYVLSRESPHYLQRWNHAVGVHVPLRSRLPRPPPSVAAAKSINRSAAAHNTVLHVGAQAQRAIPKTGSAEFVSRTLHDLPTISSAVFVSKPALPTRTRSSMSPPFRNNHALSLIHDNHSHLSSRIRQEEKSDAASCAPIDQTDVAPRFYLQGASHAQRVPPGAGSVSFVSSSLPRDPAMSPCASPSELATLTIPPSNMSQTSRNLMGRQSLLSSGASAVENGSSASTVTKSGNNLAMLSDFCTQLDYLEVAVPSIEQPGESREDLVEEVDEQERGPIGENADHGNDELVENLADSDCVPEELISKEGAKAFRCLWTGCDQSTFRRRWDCKVHVKNVHFKLRSYKCPIVGCDSRFGTRGSLTKHKRVVHENLRPFKCKFPGCKWAFGEKGNLNKHMQRKHKA